MSGSLISHIDRFFGITARGSSIRTEILAGLTTFLSMCYILVVNPAMLMVAGVPFGDAVWATIISACAGTLLIGLYANRPYVVAPIVSQSTLVVYVLCGVLNYPWRAVLGASLVAGLLFSLFIVSGYWDIFIKSIPGTISRSCTRGIGFFIAFLGSSNSGIILVGAMAVTSPYLRDIQPSNLFVLLAGITVIGVIMIRKKTGALICGILTCALLAYALGIEKLPTDIVTAPPAFSGLQWYPDIAAVLTPTMIPVVVLLFFLTLFDSIASIFGLSSLIHQNEEPRDNSDIRRSFLTNGLSMMVSPLVGCTTSAIFIESVAGVEEGGKTGLVAVVAAVLIAASLFFLPLVTAFPDVATSAVLLVIGLLMLAQFRIPSLSSRGEMLTAFVLMVTMSITQNIGLGLSIGIIVYPLFMFAAGKQSEIPRVFWGLVVCAAIFLVIFPY
ncbi:NCS2 family permease [uncultured Methanospirillum sp.]|uniref:NCS2 family permease n=1 Tax=uncultured Methanospirillum sp. TaxID=262503 RepID=UPI0029C83198|nr:NCS2 family permease [uncultured Methanospirillum sp.]